MSEQLIFDLPIKTAFGRADFFVTDANKGAVAMLSRGADSPVALILVGEAGAGKSHLAQIWAEDSGAAMISAADLAGADLQQLAGAPLCIEDCCIEDCGAMNNAAQNNLLHLYNLMAEGEQSGAKLLLTSLTEPKQWGITLPDLLSRLQAAALARLSPPDDQLLAAILLKQFEDRQILIEPRLLGYILSRMERSFVAARRLVQEMDKIALGKGKPIGQGIAREVLARIETGNSGANP